MTAAATRTRYSAVTQAIHWLTAILVLAAYLLGEGGPESRVYSAERASQLHLHETLGMAVFALLVLRLVWRSFDRAPQEPMAAWMRIGSRLIQGLLYLLLAAVPLTAIIGAWYGGHPVTVIGIGDIGPFGTLSTDIAGQLNELHQTLGNVIIWVAGLHAAAALFHHFFLRDRVLLTMLPFGRIRT